jgi:hypothetical protein
MRQSKILIICLFAVLSEIQAQVKTSQGLKIGDTLPGLVLTNLMDSSVGGVRLTDLKAKLVILDFWNVHCSSCILGFKKMQMLEDMHPSEVRVLLVTRDTKLMVQELARRSKLVRESRLTMVVGDTLFSKYFPNGTPHHVWIDKDRVIRAIINPWSTSEETVSRFLQTNHIKSRDIFIGEKLNLSQPLSGQLYNQPAFRPMRYSFLTSRVDGIPVSEFVEQDSVSKQIAKRAFYNRTLMQLIKIAWGGFDPVNNIFGLSWDKSRIINQSRNEGLGADSVADADIDDWNAKNTFSYELAGPSTDWDYQKVMQLDVQAAFKVKVIDTIMIMTVYELKRVFGSRTAESKSKISEFRKDYNMEKVVMRNQPVVHLITYLSSYLQPNIIVDSTGITSTIDIDLPLSFAKGVEEANEWLNKYGLKLVKSLLPQRLLIIKDDNTN